VDFMNWKKSIIPATLSLALLIPTVAFASNDISGTENTRNFGRFGTEATNRSLGLGKRLNKSGELSEEAKAKFEEIKAKLESGEITREELMEQMKSNMPEGAHFKLERKNFDNKIELSEEVKVKLEELKAKLESEEITREQFHEEMKQLMPENFQLKGMRGKFNKKVELFEEVK